jgi:hypothetical protein
MLLINMYISIYFSVHVNRKIKHINRILVDISQMATVNKFCTEESCCLHDTDSNVFHCIADTYAAERCKNFIYKNSPYCKLHTKRCDQTYRQYKNICSRLDNWKLKDPKTRSDAELEKDIDVANECKRLRLDHFIDCFKQHESDEMDSGHGGAIKYADQVVVMARAELFRRKAVSGRLLSGESIASSEKQSKLTSFL